MRAKAEGVDGQSEMGFTRTMDFCQQESRIQQPERKLPPDFPAQDTNEGIMPCPPFCPFLFFTNGRDLQLCPGSREVGVRGCCI